MADIFREVDEELRRESVEKLWRKYGGYAVAAAVVVILAVGAFVGWNRYVEHRQAERARQYVAAVAASGPDGAAASQSLEELAAGSDGYATLARLQEAAAKAKAGDGAGAAAIYDGLAADSSVDRPFRDLAVILLALTSADTAAPAELTARLAPLTEAGNPWRHSALEVTALLALRAGEHERARQIYAGLADDLAAPQALRARAAEMVTALRG